MILLLKCFQVLHEMYIVCTCKYMPVDAVYTCMFD